MAANSRTKQRDIWLWGTGDEHITYTWRAGKAAQKYGGTFDGLIPELLEKYRTSKSTAADSASSNST